MAIKFQYNKTSLQQLEKQLKVRVRTLPIIKNKESALRMEVKRCKTEAADLEDRLEQQIQAYEAMFALWNEFDASLIKVNDVHLGVKKIAGVRVPLLENVEFEIRPYSMFNAPKWYADGIHLLEELAHTAIEREFMLAKLNLLEHARKKTTQKVNLFEKVQIPGYQEALRKIKLNKLEETANLAKNDSLTEVLLYTKANYYYTFNQNTQGDACFRKLINQYKEKKDYAKVSDCYKNLIGIARKANNAPLMERTYES